MLFAGRRWRWMRAMAIALLVLALIEACLMAAVAITARTMDSPAPADVIIVLGGGLNPIDGTPRATLAYRLDRAAELYEAGFAPRIVVSGGQGADEPISEAESMRRYLVALGVPDEVIELEDKSTNTQQNMEYSKAIMDAEGYHSALIVTSDYHLWRALQLAQRAGISASGAGSRNSSTLLYTLKNLARETISWAKFIFS